MLAIAVLCGGLALPARAEAGGPTTESSICSLIEGEARTHGLPAVFLTRLIWRESSFRAAVTSPAGAQGIAQFMPSTAGERGLADPFDPEQAIPKAADLLADLEHRFGNLGLAAAAYNAGSTRVATWLADEAGLPAETRAYVLDVTGHPAEDWRSGGTVPAAGDAGSATRSCSQEIAAIRDRHPAEVAGSAVVAPWGVQLAGSFSKAAAVAAYAQRRAGLAAILGEAPPMVIGGHVPSRGFRPYYQVRFPAASRALATAMCGRIMHLGGACSVSKT